MHVQLAPSRREAVAVSGGRSMGAVRIRKHSPGHGSEIERVQVVKIACRSMAKADQVAAPGGAGGKERRECRKV
jgi:hypothetical protein